MLNSHPLTNNSINNQTRTSQPVHFSSSRAIEPQFKRLKPDQKLPFLLAVDQKARSGDTHAMEFLKQILEQRKDMSHIRKECVETLRDALTADQLHLQHGDMSFLYSKLMNTPPLIFALGSSELRKDELDQISNKAKSFYGELTAAKDKIETSVVDINTSVDTLIAHTYPDLVEGNMKSLEACKDTREELVSKHCSDGKAPDENVRLQLQKLDQEISRLESSIENRQEQAKRSQELLENTKLGIDGGKQQLEESLRKLGEIVSCIGSGGSTGYLSCLQQAGGGEHGVFLLDMPLMVNENNMNFVVGLNSVKANEAYFSNPSNTERKGFGDKIRSGWTSAKRWWKSTWIARGFRALGNLWNGLIHRSTEPVVSFHNKDNILHTSVNTKSPSDVKKYETTEGLNFLEISIDINESEYEEYSLSQKHDENNNNSTINSQQSKSQYEKDLDKYGEEVIDNLHFVDISDTSTSVGENVSSQTYPETTKEVLQQVEKTQPETNGNFLSIEDIQSKQPDLTDIVDNNQLDQNLQEPEQK